MSIGSLVGAPFGAEGVALGLSIGTVAVAPAYARPFSRELAMSPLAIMAEAIAPIAAASVMTVVVGSALGWTSSFGPWLQLAATILLGAFTFIATLLALSWRSIASDLRLLTSGDPASDR